MSGGSDNYHRNEYMQKIRGMSEQELHEELVEKNREIQRIETQLRSGTAMHGSNDRQKYVNEFTGNLRRAKKDKARIKTVLNQKQYQTIKK